MKTPQIFKAIGASSLQQISNIFIQLLTVPILLSFWGMENFGAWIVLSAVPSYLSLSDFGFGTASSNRMAMHLARAEHMQASTSFFASLSVTITSAIIICAGASALVWLISPEMYLKVGNIDTNATRWIILLLITSTIFNMVRTTFYSILFSDGRFSIGITLLTFCRTLEFLALILAAALGGKMETAAAAVAVIAAINTTLYGWFAVSSAHWLARPTAQRVYQEIISLARPSFAFLLFPISNAINLQGVVTLLSLSGSGPAVVGFTTVRTLSRLAVMPLRSIMDSLRPEISRLFGLSNYQDLQKLHFALATASLWGGACIALGLLAVGPTMIHFWTKGHVAADLLVMALLTLTAMVQAIAYPNYMLLYGSNRHQLMAAAYLAINLLMILGLAIASPPSSQQASIALLIAELSMASFTIWRSAGILNLPVVKMLMAGGNLRSLPWSTLTNLVARKLSRVRGT